LRGGEDLKTVVSDLERKLLMSGAGAEKKPERSGTVQKISRDF
jgi:hypothetical protein